MVRFLPSPLAILAHQTPTHWACFPAPWTKGDVHRDEACECLAPSAGRFSCLLRDVRQVGFGSNRVQREYDASDYCGGDTSPSVCSFMHGQVEGSTPSSPLPVGVAAGQQTKLRAPLRRE